mgnify:CR=1 FL=1
MKAKSIILFLLVASLMACSNNPEALVRKFEKAVAAGNYAKADEIANKMAELGGDSFTQEQKERILGHLKNPEEMLSPYGISAVDMTAVSSEIFIRRFMNSKIAKIMDNESILETNLHF